MADMYADQVANIREKMAQLNSNQEQGIDEIQQSLSSKFTTSLGNFDDKWKSVQDAGLDDLAGLAGVKGSYMAGKKLYSAGKSLRAKFKARSAARKAKQLDEDDLDDDADPVEPSVSDAVGGGTPNPNETRTPAEIERAGPPPDYTPPPPDPTLDADDDDFDDDETTPQTEGGEGDFDESTSFSDPAAADNEAFYTPSEAPRPPAMTDTPAADSAGNSNITAEPDLGSAGPPRPATGGLGEVDDLGGDLMDAPTVDLSQTYAPGGSYQARAGLGGENDLAPEVFDPLGSGSDLSADAQSALGGRTAPPRSGEVEQPGQDLSADPEGGLDLDAFNAAGRRDAGLDPTPEGGGDSLVGGGQGAVEEGLDDGASLLSRTGSSIFQNLAEKGQNIRAGFNSVKSFFSSSKSAAGDAGTDLAEAGGEAAAEGGGEVLAGLGVGDAILGAIPVVGEIGLAVSGLVAIGEGIYHLFHPPTKPKSPPPAPQVEAPQSLTMKYSMALPSADNSIDRAASVGAF